VGEGLTERQAACIQQAAVDLLDAMRVHTDADPQLNEAIKLVVRKRRVVGVKIRCEVTPPAGVKSVEWLNNLTAAISRLTGYGEVKAILEDGEVVGARVDVSYDLNHFKEV